MNFLALDTSSNACSVALQIGENIEASHVVKPREHTAILIPMIEAILRDAQVSLNELEGIVLGNGPGSFIGMRIAASVAQGMAFGAGLSIIPISSLAAIAAEAFSFHDGSRVLVAQDAHMNEVYLQAFTRDKDGVPRAEGDVQLHNAMEMLDHHEGKLLAAGAGWHRYPEMLDNNEQVRSGQVNILYPNARYLLALGRRDWARGKSIVPDKVVPEYVRMKVASRPDS